MPAQNGFHSSVAGQNCRRPTLETGGESDVEPGPELESPLTTVAKQRANPLGDYWAGPRENTTFEAKNAHGIREKVCLRASTRACTCNHMTKGLITRSINVAGEQSPRRNCGKKLYFCTFFTIEPHFAHFPANTSEAHGGKETSSAVISGFRSRPGCVDVCVFIDFYRFVAFFVGVFRNLWVYPQRPIVRENWL